MMRVVWLSWHDAKRRGDGGGGSGRTAPVAGWVKLGRTDRRGPGSRVRARTVQLPDLMLGHGLGAGDPRPWAADPLATAGQRWNDGG